MIKLNALKPGTQVKKISSDQVVHIATDKEGKPIFREYNGKNRVGVVFTAGGAKITTFLDLRDIKIL